MLKLSIGLFIFTVIKQTITHKMLNNTKISILYCIVQNFILPLH
jgi:hypothetical protein